MQAAHANATKQCGPKCQAYWSRQRRKAVSPEEQHNKSFWRKPGHWEHCSVWSADDTSSRAPPPPPQQQAPLAALQTHAPRVTDAPLLLALGIITAPRNLYRRAWIRPLVVAHSESMRHAFVIGNLRVRKTTSYYFTADGRAQLAAEQVAHRDLLVVPARDAPPYAVAEKTLAWYRAALALFPNARHVAKTDDDTIVNVRTLLADVRALAAPNLYYGVLRWRMWQVADSCGPMGPLSPATLQAVYAAAQAECRNASGPFPFADGSLAVLGAALVRWMLRGAAA